MTTVNTVEDIIIALDADPLLQEALRSRLLTRDLLELPQVVDELAKSHLRLESALYRFIGSTEVRFSSLEKNQREMGETQREIIENQANMGETQRRMIESQRQMIESQREMGETQRRMIETQREMGETQRRIIENQREMGETQHEIIENQRVSDSRLDSLETTVAGMKNDLDFIKGDHMEMRLQGKVQSLLFQRMSLRRVQIVRALYPAGSMQWFLEALYDAEEAGIITGRHYERVLDTDMILSGRRLGGEDVYVAMEVANKLDRGDVDRALMSAEVLALTLPGSEVLAAVYGREISDADKTRAENSGVTVILDESRR